MQSDKPDPYFPVCILEGFHVHLKQGGTAIIEAAELHEVVGKRESKIIQPDPPYEYFPVCGCFTEANLIL